jgi:predicted O-linked N-acetylglucosamine transferase (SPINDLY family)
LHRAGRLVEAGRAYADVLRRDPRHHAALFAASVLELGSGRLESAARLLERAVGAAPLAARYHVNLGEVKRRLGALDEAVSALLRALELEPELPEAAFNLGLVHTERGDAAGAAAAFELALKLRPESAPFRLAFARSLAALAAALADHQKLVEAAETAERALELVPDLAEAHYRLGNALFGLGEVERAASCFRRAVELDAGQIVAHSNLVLALGYVAGESPGASSLEARRWAERHADALRPASPVHPNARAPERRLRVGYVSADFRRHPAAHFILPILSHHDRAGFEVYCYSSVARPDLVTERARRCADVFRDVSRIDDRALAELVRSDEVDLLVDLSMHTGGHRLLAFAQRPAPVQITYLAYPGGTTGLATVDYRLTTRSLEPEDPRSPASPREAPLFLGDVYWCYDPLLDLLGGGEPPAEPTPATTSHFPTFGSQNSFHKLGDRTFALWSKVLRAHDGARLVFHAPDSARERVEQRLVAAGIDPARVTLLPRRERSAYLAAFSAIDLCLDSTPYNGATTTLDAFSMGVPTLTLAGEAGPSRAGLSLCTSLGLPELVASSEQDFVDKALFLTGDLPRLNELRRTLRTRLMSSPLTDAPRFVRNLESRYRDAWKRYCS